MNIFKKLIKFSKREIKYVLWHTASYVPFLPSIMFHYVRPYVWKLIGVNMGKNVAVGYGVYLDVDGAKRVKIGDNVMIASQCLLLCHRRDLRTYNRSVLQVSLPYLKEGVVVNNNVIIGMRSVVLPGVTIGEGAVVAAGSVVVKDVPPFTIVGGNPAKVLREIS